MGFNADASQTQPMLPGLTKQAHGLVETEGAQWDPFGSGGHDDRTRPYMMTWHRRLHRWIEMTPLHSTPWRARSLLSLSLFQ